MRTLPSSLKTSALAVLLRFGLLSLVVMFYTFMLIEAFPPTVDFSRPYAGISVGLLAAIVPRNRDSVTEANDGIVF